jgi:hypothetical protein
MKRIIASMVLIVIGLVCACSAYFEPRPRDSLKAEELVAIDFCHLSGWIILGVGMISACGVSRERRKIHS